MFCPKKPANWTLSLQKIIPPPTEDLAWVIGPYQEPNAHVTPGKTVQISTLDAFGNLID